MTLTPQQDRMNRAVDNLLTRAELLEFQAILEDDPDQALQFERLRAVDDLLQHPPLAVPAPDFTARVMARIEAGEYRAYAPYARANRALSWLGMVAVFILIPAFVLAAIVIPVLAQPGIFMGVFQRLVGSLATLSAWLHGVQQLVGGLIATYPMLPALAVTIIPVGMVWVWLVWFLQQRNRPATVMIPVQVQS